MAVAARGSGGEQASALGAAPTSPSASATNVIPRRTMAEV
jgi:hypothetical protein